MDLQSVKFEKWTVETALMKHTARKYSMNIVAQTYIRKQAAECGIESYEDFLKNVRDNPEAYDTLTDAQRDFSDLSTSVGMWATVAACIKPYISVDEWISLSGEQIESLSTIVGEVNPHWFMSPDQEKKTDEPQMKSIQN